MIRNIPPSLPTEPLSEWDSPSPVLYSQGCYGLRGGLSESGNSAQWRRMQMSLAGVRPPTWDEVAHYREAHWRRLEVKPGLTGQWQISGRSTIKDFEEIV